MDILHSIILGIVQGITEFFPISSSGHLLLFKNFFNISDDGMFIEVLLHGGTHLSILVYYRKDILIEKNKIFKGNYRFVINLIIATLPAAIIGLLYKDEIEKFFFNSSPDQLLLYLSYSFLFTAIILLMTKFIKTDNYIDLSYLTALYIGFAQMFALFPGISRSGITIAVALFLGINKRYATKFSFMLAIPIISFAFIESIYTNYDKRLSKSLG